MIISYGTFQNVAKENYRVNYVIYAVVAQFNFFLSNFSSFFLPNQNSQIFRIDKQIYYFNSYRTLIKTIGKIYSQLQNNNSVRKCPSI